MSKILKKTDFYRFLFFTHKIYGKCLYFMPEISQEIQTKKQMVRHFTIYNFSLNFG